MENIKNGKQQELARNFSAKIKGGKSSSNKKMFKTNFEHSSIAKANYGYIVPWQQKSHTPNHPL